MEIKLSVTFILPGRVLCGADNCQSVENEKFSIHVFTKKGGHENLTVTTRGCKPASQVINMSKEALYAMITDPAPGYNLKRWATLSRNERIKKHLDITAEYLGAKSFTWTEYKD